MEEVGDVGEMGEERCGSSSPLAIVLRVVVRVRNRKLVRPSVKRRKCVPCLQRLPVLSHSYYRDA